jgi:hypothetical protein
VRLVIQGSMNVFHVECAKANEEEKFVSLITLITLITLVAFVSDKLQNPVILRISDVDESVFSCINIL